MDQLETIKIFRIEARTGCSCCSDENHYRGPYKTREDAERRVKFYLEEEGDKKYWPIGSQYARRGRYTIEEHLAEILPGNRWIIEDRVYKVAPFIEIAEDGSSEQNNEERFEQY